MKQIPNRLFAELTKRSVAPEKHEVVRPGNRIAIYSGFVTQKINNIHTKEIINLSKVITVRNKRMTFCN